MKSDKIHHRIIDLKIEEKPILLNLQYCYTKNVIRNITNKDRHNHRFSYDEEDLLKVENIYCEPYPEKIIFDHLENPLVAAIKHAYLEHIPLKISPDMIWLTILQGFAIHTNKNYKELKSKFVLFNQKKSDITIYRPDINLDNLSEKANEISDEFKKELLKKVNPETFSLLDAKFSTTTSLFQKAFDITIMSAVQMFFDFQMYYGCAIPKVKLEGTVEDWGEIIKRIKKFDEFGLEFWTKYLIPILEKIKKAAEGEDDIVFWNCIFKTVEGGLSTGIPVFDGWSICLFPYVGDDYTKKNLLPNRFFQPLEYYLEFKDVEYLKYLHRDKTKDFQYSEENQEEEFYPKWCSNYHIPEGNSACEVELIEMSNKDIKSKLILNSGFLGCLIDDEGFIFPQVFYSVSLDLENKINDDFIKYIFS